jgi:hypothetical protein
MRALVFIFGALAGGVAVYWIQYTPLKNCLPVSRFEVSQAFGERDKALQEIVDRMADLERRIKK